MTNDSVFEKELELDGKVKKMIKALVEQHKNKEVGNLDLIEGKGRGLVILLHGRYSSCAGRKQDSNIFKVPLVLGKQSVIPFHLSVKAIFNRLQ